MVCESLDRREEGIQGIVIDKCTKLSFASVFHLESDSSVTCLGRGALMAWI